MTYDLTMGNEALCRVTYDGMSGEAKALLETDELVVRAPFRLKVPFAEATDVEADGGALKLRWKSRQLRLDLGEQAAKWAEKIRNPKSVVQKLGIKPGQKISIVGKLDAGFLKDLTRTGAEISPRLSSDSDIIFFAADANSELRRLRELKNSLVSNGAIWVVRPKGTAAITDAHVIAAGKAAGLVDTKVVRFSTTHTAEKLVIPVTKRK